jgi:hypothetical protein
MGFFGKIGKGFKKLGKGIKNTAKKVGKAVSKGIKWGKKQFNKVNDAITDIPVIGDAVKEAETLAQNIPGVSQALGAIDTVEDLASGDLQKALRDGAQAFGGPLGSKAVAVADAIEAGLNGDTNALANAGVDFAGNSQLSALNDVRNQVQGNN